MEFKILKVESVIKEEEIRSDGWIGICDTGIRIVDVECSDGTVKTYRVEEVE